jgi:hypothetical protein
VSGPIVEGDFVSSVRKCEHGVFKPGDSWISERNRSCSICRSFMPELFRAPGPGKKVAKRQKHQAVEIEVEVAITDLDDDLGTEEIKEEEVYEEY